VKTFRWTAGLAMLTWAAIISPVAAALALLAVAAFVSAVLTHPKLGRWEPPPICERPQVFAPAIEPEDAIPSGYPGCRASIRLIPHRKADETYKEN
jgi:hypothetical protein